MVSHDYLEGENFMKKLISVLLLLSMILSLLPTAAFAAKVKITEISAEAMEIIKEDVWSVIDDYEEENVVAKWGPHSTVASYCVSNDARRHLQMPGGGRVKRKAGSRTLREQ